MNGSATAQQAASLPIANPGLIPTPVLPTQIMTTQVVEPVGTPSECLLLKNMFDPTTEVRIDWLNTATEHCYSFIGSTNIRYYNMQTEPDFDLDIKEDVEEECSKYGRVKHIYVDK